MDRNERIGIVGAGPAGISMAVALADAGFRRVTVLEREAWPGGKCRTFRMGGDNWELGAILGSTDYRNTIALMDRVGMAPYRPPRPGRPDDAAFIPKGFWPMDKVFPGWLGLGDLAPALCQIARYHLLAGRWKAVFGPGHAGVSPELAMSFADWVERYRMGTLSRMMAIPYTTFGYGYYDEAPAAYVLKFFDPGIVRAMVLQGKFFKWKEGIQTLWERLAAGLDVRYSVDIREVRRGDSVSVRGLSRADGSPFSLEFDRLVLACPVDDALGFLDAADEEKDLYGRVLYKDYRVYLRRVEGLRVPAGFAPGRFGREGVGRAMIWDERVPGSGVHTFYVLADGTMSDAEVEAGLDEDVVAMGGRTVEDLATVRWKYYPHVSCDDYRAGWYDRFEALQGARRSCVTGEIASFSTVERSVRYSKDLVRRLFA